MSDCKYICKRLEMIGTVREKLRVLMMESDLIPDDLSKHNPYFDSEHQAECEKLYDLRCKFKSIEESLWDIFSVMDHDEYIDE